MNKIVRENKPVNIMKMRYDEALSLSGVKRTLKVNYMGRIDSPRDCSTRRKLFHELLGTPF